MRQQTVPLVSPCQVRGPHPSTEYEALSQTPRRIKVLVYLEPGGPTYRDHPGRA